MKYVKLIVKTIVKEKCIDGGSPPIKYWADIEMPSCRIIRVRLTQADYQLLGGK